MTTFTCRLEKVLRWRQTQLELEQFALSRIAAECVRWDEALKKLEDGRRAAEEAAHSSGPVGGGYLAALATYQKHIRHEKQVCHDRRRECERKMEQQRARLLKARREFRLLERLRQLRHAEWEVAVDREFEALAAEAYLARWAPRPRSVNGLKPLF
jgi:flagellar export protein FliJ